MLSPWSFSFSCISSPSTSPLIFFLSISNRSRIIIIVENVIGAVCWETALWKWFIQPKIEFAWTHEHTLHILCRHITDCELVTHSFLKYTIRQLSASCDRFCLKLVQLMCQTMLLIETSDTQFGSWIVRRQTRLWNCIEIELSGARCTRFAQNNTQWSVQWK